MVEDCDPEVWLGLVEGMLQACQIDQNVAVFLQRLLYVSPKSSMQTSLLTALFLFSRQVTVQEIIQII